MIRLFILSFLFLSSYCKGQVPGPVKSDYIRIDHVGPIDKPIIPIIISTKELTLPITESLVQVNENIFVLLVDYIRINKHVNSERKVNEFGVFKITTLVNGKTKTGFTPARNKSIHFFRDLLDQLKNNKLPSEKLVEEIERILTRIDFEAK